jgi:hypothetical protein
MSEQRTPQGYIILGYWSKTAESAAAEGLPWPGDQMNPAMSAETRTLVGDYLDALYAPVRYYMGYRGWSQCRLCGKHNGSAEWTDGTYAWPTGLSHYVREHGVKLPVEFIRHIGVVRGARQQPPR